MKKEIDVIETTQPLPEIWSSIDYLRSVYSCEQFLKERIENNFYGLGYERLSLQKDSSGLELDDSRIINSRDINRKAIELFYDVNQAKEYYKAARTTTELTLPVLLYYGMVSLGKALVDSTFEFIDPEKTHGLTHESVRKISLKPRGFFTRFHDTYNPDPAIYVRTLSFSIQELLSMIPDVQREYKMAYGEKSRINPQVDIETNMSDHFILEKDGLNLAFPALTSHFLLMFLLSSLARYRPEEWGKIIEGKGSVEIYPIRKFLRVSARRFPNLIINELFGKIFIFNPGARVM